MKKIAILSVMAAVLLGFAGTSYASDWDLVGKVLTGVEGARILTGGKLDVIGGVMDVAGVNSCGNRRPQYRERVWVADYRWENVWVPAHTVYDPEYGNLYVHGQYVKRQVECGGHWEYAARCLSY